MRVAEATLRLWSNAAQRDPSIRSADAVRVDTGAETLDAGAAAILESGHRMVFSGGIRLSLTPKARTVAPVDAAPEKDTP